MAKIRGGCWGGKWGYFLVYIHLRQGLKISGGNVDEEDSGYLKRGGAHIIIHIYIAFFFEIFKALYIGIGKMERLRGW